MLACALESHSTIFRELGIPIKFVAAEAGFLPLPFFEAIFEAGLKAVESLRLYDAVGAGQWPSFLSLFSLPHLEIPDISFS
jgi:hypothetical protein